MSAMADKKIDWAAFLRTPAFSYLLLTLVVVLAGLATLLLTSL